MEYREITEQIATPVSFVGMAPKTPETAGLPACLRTAHRYAPALGGYVQKARGTSNAGAEAPVSKGVKS